MQVNGLIPFIAAWIRPMKDLSERRKLYYASGMCEIDTPHKIPLKAPILEEKISEQIM
jgi:hypothetical protein